MMSIGCNKLNFRCIGRNKLKTGVSNLEKENLPSPCNSENDSGTFQKDKEDRIQITVVQKQRDITRQEYDNFEKLRDKINNWHESLNNDTNAYICTNTNDKFHKLEESLTDEDTL